MSKYNKDIQYDGLWCRPARRPILGAHLSRHECAGKAGAAAARLALLDGAAAEIAADSAAAWLAVPQNSAAPEARSFRDKRRGQRVLAPDEPRHAAMRGSEGSKHWLSAPRGFGASAASHGSAMLAFHGGSFLSSAWGGGVGGNEYAPFGDAGGVSADRGYVDGVDDGSADFELARAVQESLNDGGSGGGVAMPEDDSTENVVADDELSISGLSAAGFVRSFIDALCQPPGGPDIPRTLGGSQAARHSHSDAQAIPQSMWAFFSSSDWP